LLISGLLTVVDNQRKASNREAREEKSAKHAKEPLHLLSFAPFADFLRDLCG
jgi:hypothetical protein